MANSVSGSSTDPAIPTKDDEKIELKRAEGLVLILDTPKGIRPSSTPRLCFSEVFLDLCIVDSWTNGIWTGRGVFANKDIPGKSIIEICPVLVLDPVENEEHIKKTELYHYT
jgi:hypothetical protein